jgi:hypothetical protein
VSRVSQILLFAAVAGLAAFIGYSQTLAYKIWPPTQLAIWFPWAVFASRLTGDASVMVLAALAQYPFFTLVFALGVRRWSVQRVLIAICGLHAITIAIAFATLR